tara:strand:- start:40 stop:705 length:666 start_codon:yes stop_codon:yes gene_type:complete
MKIRCSSLGQVMTNSRKKGELSKTAQSCIKQIVKEEMLGVRRVLSNKYLDKGIIMEDAAIDLVVERYELDPFTTAKNEEYFENDFIKGTPDLILEDSVRDIKCSWGVDTFPMLDEEIPNKDYYWQLMGYMALTGKRKAFLDYCLVDTPQHLIERELSSMIFRGGEMSKEAEEEVRLNMTFGHIETHLRVKTFSIEWDEEAWEAIKNRITECNEYSHTLITK